MTKSKSSEYCHGSFLYHFCDGATVVTNFHCHQIEIATQITYTHIKTPNACKYYSTHTRNRTLVAL